MCIALLELDPSIRNAAEAQLNDFVEKQYVRIVTCFFFKIWIIMNFNVL